MPDVQARGLGLHSQVGDGLAKVIQRELGVLPVGVFHVAVRQVGDQQARRRRPGAGAAGQLPDQAGVGGIPAPAQVQPLRVIDQAQLRSASYGIAGSAGIRSSGVPADGASAGAAVNEVAHGFRSRWMTRAMFWIVFTP